MNRGPTYTDMDANPYQRQQPMSAQRMQQPPSAANDYPGRADGFRAEEEQRQFASGKAEGQWQWDRDAQQMSPTLYSDGQRANTSSRSFYPSQIPDAQLVLNQESSVNPREEDMEVGYEENPAPRTLEGIEKKFQDDIMKLTQEQADIEDSENARHKKKIIEINDQFQEKLSALRARQATRREEILRKESQARLQQYQLAGVGTYQPNSVVSDMSENHHGYKAPGPISGEPQRHYGSSQFGSPGPVPSESQTQYGGSQFGSPGPIPGEPQRYTGSQFESYRHPESYGHGGIQGTDTRVPTPGGRVYNTGPRYY